MKSKICVYTCITGNYDNLNEIKNSEDNIDYYCFTNNKSLKSKTWKVIQIDNGELDNRLLARKIKILGHSIINDNYDIAVWTDADVIWETPISDFVNTYFKNTNFAIFKHHARNTINEEAIACLLVRKDSKENIIKTLNFYNTIKYPDNNGLCESTVFIKNPKDQQVIETTKIWYDMVKEYSPRDQLSFNYAIWKTGLKVKYINLNVWGNPWFSTALHNPEPKIDSCHVYYGNSNEDFDIHKYYIYEYHKKNQNYSFHATIPFSTKRIEINPTNIVGIKYQDLTISPKPNHTETDGIFLSTTYNTRGMLYVYGDFKKGEKLSLSFIASSPSSTEISKILKHQHEKDSKIIQKLQFENKELSIANTELKENLHQIINSKGWQALEKIRKILPHKPKK